MLGAAPSREDQGRPRVRSLTPKWCFKWTCVRGQSEMDMVTRLSDWVQKG